MKITRQTQTKILVNQFFINSTKPVTIKEIYLSLKQVAPQTAFSTIYRLVRQMEEQKQIIRVDWRERGSFYESTHLEHHHHFVCQKCGGVFDISHDMLNFDLKRLEKICQFEIADHSIEFRGTCKNCLNENYH